MAWNRWEHSRVIVGFYINYFTVGALGTQTVMRRFLATASKPAAVLDTFRFTVAPVLIRDTTRTYRFSFVIKAKDVRMRVVKFKFSTRIQCYERYHVIVFE